MKKIKKVLPASEKISGKVLDVAGWYIYLGDTFEDYDLHLQVAWEGWNIACLEREEIDNAVKKAMVRLRLLFGLFENNSKILEQNLRLIIKRKRNIYPKEKFIIDHAEFKMVGADFQLVVHASKNEE